MNGRGKSDGPIVPGKSPNKGGPVPPPAEGMEGRGPAKGNPAEQNRNRAQHRALLQNALDRIRQAAKRNRKERFTTLWHHVCDPNRLREAYFGLKHNAAAGVDGETWDRYGQDLEANLRNLSDRLKRGAYRARPVRRVYIPKADGRLRPIGIPVLEDKIVQRATVEVLNAIYEAEFKGFSYGFRPRRSQHHALDALSVGLMRRRVNWVFDADVRGYFDAIDHEWLVKFVEHRIADKRVVRHIRKWLNAGVLEGDELRRMKEGTPQGGSVSPLLANIYLHYVLDLWAHQWRRQKARGDVIIVRYADDFIVGFEHRHDAERFWAELKERFQKFHLELHPEKTRLIEFGRFAAANRERRGEGKPETFDFLGFTHICSRTKRGRFAIRRKTIRKRLRAKVKALRKLLYKQRHRSIPLTGAWLRSVLKGHYNYYGVPYNYPNLCAFRQWVVETWLWTLRRRSQKVTISWERMERIAKRWLPTPRIVHPYPDQRLRV